MRILMSNLILEVSQYEYEGSEVPHTSLSSEINTGLFGKVIQQGV